MTGSPPCSMASIDRGARGRAPAGLRLTFPNHATRAAWAGPFSGRSEVKLFDLTRPGGDRDRRQRRDRSRHGARAWPQAGAAVVVAARDEAKNGEAVARARGARRRRRSPSRSTSRRRRRAGPWCRRRVERFGRLDVLVNNAGTNIRKAARGVHARGVAPAARDQSHERVHVQPGGLSGDAAGGRRQDRR